MKVAAVINTCAEGTRQTTAGPSGVPYGVRGRWIRDIIVPALAAAGCDPIIVAGEFSDGDGYVYVPVQNQYGNCRDVLAQRQAGWDRARKAGATHGWFQMDDHLIERAGAPFFDMASLPHFDVLSPERRSRTGEVLNSGWNNVGAPDIAGPYFHTHAVLLTKEALEQCPWNTITPIYRFDVLSSWYWEDRKLAMLASPEHVIIDLETLP